MSMTEETMDELRATAERYRQALEKYGQHLPECAKLNPLIGPWGDKEFDCDCGFDAASSLPAPQFTHEGLKALRLMLEYAEEYADEHMNVNTKTQIEAAIALARAEIDKITAILATPPETPTCAKHGPFKWYELGCPACEAEKLTRPLPATPPQPQKS